MGFELKSRVLFPVTLVSLLIAACVVVVEWSGGIETASPSGQNLKGGIHNNNTRRGVCLVSVIDIEIDDGKNKSEEEDEEEEMLVCNRVSGSYDSGVSDTLLYIKNMASATVSSNQVALRKNEWFIEFSHDWIEAGKHQIETITIPDLYEVRTMDPDNVPHHLSDSPSHRRILASKLHERHRRLATTTGNRTVVIVSVDSKVSNYILQDHFFGQNNSLVTQMDSCSQGQVRILPHPTHPIIKVSPPLHPSQYTFVDLYTTVLDDIKDQLGLRKGQSITSFTDHIFLIVPDAIDRRPGELGWGATPGFFAGTVESLSISRSTMTLLHEIGHNWGLGHAYEDKVAYSDMSTVMGYSHRNVVKMCFNGFNMWDLGWFPDRSHTIRLTDNKNERDVFDLAFYGDYDKTTALQPVIARYKDIYLTFNRQKAMNVQTKEYGDQLLIVQEYPGEYHSHSNLEEALAVGDAPHQMKFNNNKDKIFIEVCSFTRGNDSRPDVLTVAVARKQDSICPPQGTSKGATANNLTVSTSSPIPSGNCQNANSSVRLKELDEYGEIQYETKACRDLSIGFLSDRAYLCSQVDTLTQLPVREVCRIECPGTGCAD